MTETDPLSLHLADIGRGRLGTAITAALRAAGLHVDGPLGRTPTLDTLTHQCCFLPIDNWHQAIYL